MYLHVYTYVRNKCIRMYDCTNENEYENEYEHLKMKIDMFTCMYLCPKVLTHASMK